MTKKKDSVDPKNDYVLYETEYETEILIWEAIEASLPIHGIYYTLMDTELFEDQAYEILMIVKPKICGPGSQNFEQWSKQETIPSFISLNAAEHKKFIELFQDLF